MQSKPKFSKHGRIRAQQRGVSAQTIRLILEFADRRVHLARGVQSLSISRRRADYLVAAGVQPAAVMARTNSVAALVGHDTLVTVVHITRRQHR